MYNNHIIFLNQSEPVELFSHLQELDNILVVIKAP
jgi:hypothetical protein